MNERDIAKYAAMVAAGTILEDELSAVIGDDNIVQKIMSVAATGAILGSVGILVEDVVDDAMDVVDAINPFKW